ncbi:MAG TPA: response regulator [Gemmataceae bacterium]|nr:response regulator [Gemmataceae bacterium]
MVSSQTILVVEDDPTVREAVSAALTRKGYNVVTADDGVDAIRLAADHPPDLAVVEMLLPGASGFQVAQALKAATDGRVPVVMVSATSSDAHQDYAFASGADRFLAKPFAVGGLTEIVLALCPLPSGSKAIPLAATRA